MQNFDLNWYYPQGKSIAAVSWKNQLDDFHVVEELEMDWSNEGEYLWLQVTKKDMNTETLAKQLAKAARIPAEGVSWSGLKDKFGVTQQWFSLHLQSKINLERWKEILTEKQTAWWQINDFKVHHRKLKVGTHLNNSFTILIKVLSDDKLKQNPTRQFLAIEERLNHVKESGFANYFGPQRFGNQLKNLTSAQNLFENGKKIKNKHIRGLVLSAARSFLFNLQVNYRIQQSQFHQALDGDVFQINKSSSIFSSKDLEDCQQRMDQQAIHPTAVLMGSGKALSQGESLQIENHIQSLYPLWVRRLKDFKLKLERRAIRALPQEMSWEMDKEKSEITLRFTLGRGMYASSLLSSCFHLKTPDHKSHLKGEQEKPAHSMDSFNPILPE